MKLNHRNHIGVAIAAISLMLTVPYAAAKKASSKPASMVPMSAPNTQRTDEIRDVMFMAAFGKAAPVSRSIDEQEYSFSPEAIQPLGGDVFALLSMGNNDLAGHAQSGMNAVHYLRKTATGYKKVDEWMGIGSVGSFGQPALRYALTDKLGKNPFLITEAGGTWQGYSCGWTSLTELTPIGPVDRGMFASGYSNSGAVNNKRKVVEMDGEITSAVPDTSFTVKFSGKRKIVQTWIRGEKEYLLKGKEEIPTC